MTRSGRNDLQLIFARADRGRQRNAAVERCKAAAPLRGEPQEVDVCDLSMGHPGKFEAVLVAKGKLVRPESVVSARTEGVEASSDRRGGLMTTGVRNIRQDSDQPVLCDRTGGPPVPPVRREPCVRALVVDVVRVEECHQDVHIQQGDARQGSLLLVAEAVDPIHGRPRTSLGTSRHQRNAVAFARAS